MAQLQIQLAHRVSKRVKLETGKGLTEQAHKKECDMNYILRDYARTGLIKHAKENEGRYDDYTMQDFQEAMFITSEVKSMFEALPSLTRKQFHNNPAQFLTFAQNPNNLEALNKMGILKGNDGLNISGAITSAPVAEPPPSTTVSSDTPPTTGEPTPP